MCILQFSLMFITIFFLNSVYVTADNGQTFGQCQNAQGQHCMKTLFILLSGFVSICNPFNNNKMKVEVLTLKSVRSTSDTNLVSRLFPKARERTLDRGWRTKQGHRQPHIQSKARVIGSCQRPGARFSKVPVTFRARNQIFKSKYKE